MGGAGIIGDREEAIGVETNIHCPTDSTLLNDGVRVLTRVMKKVTQVAGERAPSCATEPGA